MKLVLAELLSWSIASTVFCPPPDARAGTVKSHENDPLPLVTHGWTGLMISPSSVTTTDLFTPKPEPFTVFAMPTAPEVLVSEIAGVTVKLAVAELRKASFASTVFGPAGTTGTVIPHENEPLLSDRHEPLKPTLVPLKFALISWLPA